MIEPYDWKHYDFLTYCRWYMKNLEARRRDDGQ